MIGAMGRRWENKTTKIGTVYTSSNLWLQNCTLAQAPSITRVVFFVSLAFRSTDYEKNKAARSLGIVG